MIPVLIELGPIKIYSYGFMLVVAFAVDFYLLRYQLKQRDMATEEASRLAGDIVLWGAIGGILGSKVYYALETGTVWENFQAVGRLVASLFTLNWSGIGDALRVLGSGLVFLGGFMGGLLAVTILIRRKGYRWLEFADMVAPLLILGYAIGRIGCFLVGDDYGIPTHLPWAVSFENGLPPSTVRVFQYHYPWIDLNGFESGLLTVHPTQLYETTMGLIIFGLLWKMRAKSLPTGMLFFSYLVLTGLERFLIEFIRTNRRYLFGLTGAQLISLAMIAIGTIFVLKLRSAASQGATLESQT